MRPHLRHDGSFLSEKADLDENGEYGTTHCGNFLVCSNHAAGFTQCDEEVFFVMLSMNIVCVINACKCSYCPLNCGHHSQFVISFGQQASGKGVRWSVDIIGWRDHRYVIIVQCLYMIRIHQLCS